MSVSDLDTAAILFDFVELYLDDQRVGRSRSLDEYLDRFEGHDQAIRDEYARLTGASRRPGHEDETSTPTPTGFHEGAVLDLAGPDLSITRYQVLREIGRGGQAAVYLATDLELGRKVALKVLRERWDTHASRSLDRLRREVRIVAGLDHPAIGQVYQAYLDHHPPCIAMRYVEGRTLSARITGCAAAGVSDGLCAPQRPDDLRRLLLLIERVARALHAAHESGVVHRDVKPANIMVDLQDQPVVLDFGLALQTDSEVTITATNETFGTPAYMSPEQIEGPSRDVDRRTDIYSLGVTLYEALTLRRPFDGPSRRQLERSICENRAPDPSVLNATVPKDLRTVLETAMEKDTARRYPTALDFAEDLRRIRLFEPIQARPVGPGVRFVRWMQRNPAVATATLALIVSLTAGLTVALGLLSKVRQANAGLEARQLAHDAIETLDTDPSRALDLALQSLSSEWTEDANTALMRALTTCRLETIIGRREQLPISSDLAPDGRVAAIGYRDGTWESWDLAARTRLHRSATASPITSLAFTVGGETLVTVHEDGSLRLHNSVTGEEHCAAQGPPGARADRVTTADGIAAASFRDGTVGVWTLDDKALTVLGHQPLSAHVIELDPSASRLLTASGATLEASQHTDHVARIWSVTQPGTVLELRGHRELINHATFSPDGAWVATASHDGTARLWAAESGAVVHEFEHPERVIHATFSPDSRKLLTLYDPGDPMQPRVSGATLWDVSTGTRIRDFAGHDGRLVSNGTFNRDGSRIATASYDGTVRVWDVSTGRRMETLRGPTHRLYTVAWTPDEERILAWDSRRLFVWNLVPRDVITMTGHDGAVLDATFSTDGRWVATAGADGTARLWDATTGSLATRLQHDGVEVTAAVFQPDGSLLATARVDGTITVWETETGERPWQHRAHQARPTQVRFSPSGAQLLTTDADGTVVIHDVANGKLTASRAAHEAAIVSARFSPDGLLIATAAADRSCRLWATATMDLLATLDDWAPGTTSRQKHVFDTVFGDGGKRLLTSSEDGHLRVYDLSSMPPILTRATPTSAVGWLSRSPDGWLVEAFKWVGTVAVRDGLDGERLTSRSIHGARLTDVDLSPDGHKLLTTSLDGTALLSEVPSLEPWAHLFGHSDFVTVGRFGPNGSRVVTGSKDGTARIWPVDPALAARNRMPIDLTSAD